MKIEAGKYYKTRDGRKVGPMKDLGISWGCDAKPEPSIDLTAITTPFGLLDKATQDALVAHGGPYEWYHAEKWLDTNFCNNAPAFAHRVKPEPKRETVTNREMYMTSRGVIASNAKPAGARPVTITYDTIDGVIDVATYRVVAR